MSAEQVTREFKTWANAGFEFEPESEPETTWALESLIMILDWPSRHRTDLYMTSKCLVGGKYWLKSFFTLQRLIVHKVFSSLVR